MREHVEKALNFIVHGDWVTKVERGTVKDVLSRLGYLDRFKGSYSEKTFRQAVANFQIAYGLNRKDGGLDYSTKNTAKRAKCWVRDPWEGLPNIRSSLMRAGEDPHSYDDDPWPMAKNAGKLILKYKLSGYPGWRVAIRKAMDKWQNDTQVIEFIEDGQTPDFEILWTPKVVPNEHNFGENFIAHASFPSSAGKKVIHFNEAKEWSDKQDTGRFNIVNVALHELGHILGLGHSFKAGDVMRNSFDEEEPEIGLSPNDVSRIVGFYA